MEDKIKDILFKIGDNPDREGLLETPTRVTKSWKELYSGYYQDPKDVFKTFKNEGFDNMVICKIIGLSKLARLTNIFSRRLQNQERLTDQIAKTLIENLDAKGAGVILEGKHFCMMSRGVQKQNSSMITSSLYGVFREQSVRQEFLTLTGGK